MVKCLSANGNIMKYSETLWSLVAAFEPILGLGMN